MISGSGHWMSFIFKICQIVVDISVTSQFYEFFNPIFGGFSHLAQLSVTASKNGGLSLSFSCFYSSKERPLLTHFHPFCERVEEILLVFSQLSLTRNSIQLFFACIFDGRFVIFYFCVRLFVWSGVQAIRPVFGMPTWRLAEKSSWWHEVLWFIFFLAIIFFLISLISSLVTPDVECSFS